MSSAWAAGSTPAWRRLRLWVLTRDGWTCQLCGEPIDPTLRGGGRRPHPMSASVHHTLGRDATGDDPRYLVAAHRRCNLAVGEPGRHDPPPRPATRW